MVTQPSSQDAEYRYETPSLAVLSSIGTDPGLRCSSTTSSSLNWTENAPWDPELISAWPGKSASLWQMMGPRSRGVGGGGGVSVSDDELGDVVVVGVVDVVETDEEMIALDVVTEELEVSDVVPGNVVSKVEEVAKEVVEEVVEVTEEVPNNSSI